MNKTWIIAAAFVISSTLQFNLHGQTEDLKPVPPKLIPDLGTFYSLQKPDHPPFPYDPFPDLPVFWFSEDEVFLIDDRKVDYDALLQNVILSLDGAGQAAAQFAGTGVGEGCGLWLSINGTTNSAVLLLTLHNTRTGQAYSVESIEDFTLTNWVVETNLTGASGDFTETLITMGTRSNLFLRASEDRDYVTNTVFLGLSFSNSPATPPDTMGAIGPNHFVELLNGVTTNTAIAVYDKSGTLISQMSMSNFFAVTVDGTNYPTGADMVDPRILYDHGSSRWVACAMELPSGSGQVILAVSNDENPTNLVSGWTRYLVRVRRDGLSVDYPTLGLDANGIYLSVLQLSGGISNHTLVAINKEKLYDGQFISALFEITNNPPVRTIQPAVNFDPVATNDHAWFVAVGPPDLGATYKGGEVWYRRLQWNGTNVNWDTNWTSIADGGVNYRDYYELAGTNIAALPSTGISAPQTNGTPINLYSAGSRLMIATIRNGYLWTCHAVGLNGTNGTYTGNATGTNVDRSAMQWFKLEVGTNGTGLTLSDHGRVFDPASTNAWWYHYPSLAVNCAGDMVAGFSGSSATNYVGAFYTWRLSSGVVLSQPSLIHPGTISYDLSRWGDYSATTVDPTDDWSFWTVQEYATPWTNQFGSIVGRWGTVIARLKPAP
jgi:hypothetical protein